MSAMPIARRAVVPTAHGSRYLQQLCKHFAHKLTVEFDPASGRIEFSIGECRLAADAAALTMTLASPSEAEMTQLEDVVARHLVRFAFREELAIDWQPA